MDYEIVFYIFLVLVGYVIGRVVGYHRHLYGQEKLAISFGLVKADIGKSKY